MIPYILWTIFLVAIVIAMSLKNLIKELNIFRAKKEALDAGDWVFKEKLRKINKDIAFNIRVYWIALGVVLVIFLWISFGALPWISWQSHQARWLIVLAMLIGLGLSCLIEYKTSKKDFLKLGAILALGILPHLMTTSMLSVNAYAYRDQLKVQVQKDCIFENVVSPIPLEQMCIVDAKEAMRIATGKMGVIKGLGSKAKIGKFVKGGWNWSNDGKEMPTDGLQKVYSNGNCYYYTGLQSIGTDDATSSFMLVDTRTGKTQIFKKEGYSEGSAWESMMGDKWIAETKGGYQANSPLFYNIHSIPTYFSVIKSTADGRRKGFAFCSLKDKLVGVGETIQEALSNYLKKVNESKNKIAILDGEVSKSSLQKLKIKEMHLINDCFYIQFEGYENNEFYAFSSLFPKLKWLKEGSIVEVEFSIGKEYSVPISKIE